MSGRVLNAAGFLLLFVGLLLFLGGMGAALLAVAAQMGGQEWFSTSTGSGYNQGRQLYGVLAAIAGGVLAAVGALLKGIASSRGV